MKSRTLFFLLFTLFSFGSQTPLFFTFYVRTGDISSSESRFISKMIVTNKSSAQTLFNILSYNNESESIEDERSFLKAFEILKGVDYSNLVVMVLSHPLGQLGEFYISSKNSGDISIIYKTTNNRIRSSQMEFSAIIFDKALLPIISSFTIFRPSEFPVMEFSDASNYFFRK